SFIWYMGGWDAAGQGHVVLVSMSRSIRRNSGSKSYPDTNCLLGMIISSSESTSRRIFTLRKLLMPCSSATRHFHTEGDERRQIRMATAGSGSFVAASKRPVAGASWSERVISVMRRNLSGRQLLWIGSCCPLSQLLLVEPWSAAAAPRTVIREERSCDQQRARAIRHGDVRAVACLEHIACLHVWGVLALVRANVELGFSALVLQLDDADSERYG